MTGDGTTGLPFLHQTGNKRELIVGGELKRRRTTCAIGPVRGITRASETLHCFIELIKGQVNSTPNTYKTNARVSCCYSLV